VRNWLIWPVLIPAILASACSKAPEQSPEPSGAAYDTECSADNECLPKELIVDLGGGLKMEFVLIPTGEFLMGGDIRYENIMPAHKVAITKPFYLGRYEVTQEQWEAVMGNNPSKCKGAKHPVETVSWDDCQEFLKKLNAKASPQVAQFLLPTEAQWEYACRAGTSTRWSFGNDETKLDEYAWWFYNTLDLKTRPVGQKRPNAWGLYDMHGNVWEWCADWGGDYSRSPAKDPTGPNSSEGNCRVLRGGSSLEDLPVNLECACRGFSHPDDSDCVLGFRVARTVPR
jgi:formylglycine-generating enzyme required for sulfatase activity